MRAINLIPPDAPRAGAVAVAGIGSYILLAGLATLVVFASLWAIAGKQVNERTSKLADVTAQTRAAEARAEAAAPYETFATLAKDRVATVTSLSATRFDWAGSLREIARVLPADAWLSAMNGTAGGGDAAPETGASAAPAPTFDITGCTRSQSKVALLMTRLRAVNGVRKVTLKTSAKADGETATGNCRPNDPTFEITISFATPGAPKETLDATGQVADATAAAGSTPPATTSESAPASTATPSQGTQLR